MLPFVGGLDCTLQMLNCAAQYPSHYACTYSARRCAAVSPQGQHATNFSMLPGTLIQAKNRKTSALGKIACDMHAAGARCQTAVCSTILAVVHPGKASATVMCRWESTSAPGSYAGFSADIHGCAARAVSCSAHTGDPSPHWGHQAPDTWRRTIVIVSCTMQLG